MKQDGVVETMSALTADGAFTMSPFNIKFSTKLAKWFGLNHLK
jgi:hypothetical protein